MGWSLSADVAEFALAVRPLLESRPVENGLGLTLTEDLLRGRRFSSAEPALGWCTTGDGVVAAVMMTPPFPLLLIQSPLEALAKLADALHARGTGVPAVNGPADAADTFAAHWTALTDRPAVLHQHQRLYELGQLRPPVPLPDGSARIAVSTDQDLLTDWMVAFQSETGSVPSTQSAYVAERIEDRRLWVWQAADGRPVSLAGRQRITAGVGRIGPVYTPSEHRRHGYGAAVTAACSADALAHGADHVVLFTDLANATSNAIYRDLGYRPVSDRKLLHFVS